MNIYRRILDWTCPISGIILGAVSLIYLNAEPRFELNVLEPYYKNGVFQTKQGGVLEGPDLRLQAKYLTYQNVDDAPLIYAENSVLFQYKGSAFVASAMTFNPKTQEAVLQNVTSYSAPFYLNAKTLTVDQEGTFIANQATMTTRELGAGYWELKTDHLRGLEKGTLLDFQGVSGKAFSIPFYLPGFRLNLARFSPSILRYNVTWDKGSGPRISARYQAYSWRQLAIFLRGEYRLSKGFGGAIETEYFPKNPKNFLITKSYLASDVVPNNLRKERRYRMQGFGLLEEGRTKGKISWDKYSDVLMPGDFVSSDFEINTEKKTAFSLLHKEPSFLVRGEVHPKINDFQTLYEKVPETFLQTKSYSFHGWIFSTLLKGGYNKFSYDDNLGTTLQNFSSGQVTLEQELYKNWQLGPLLGRAQGALKGTYDTNNPKNRGLFYGQANYALSFWGLGRKKGEHLTHITEPYLHISGYSPATRSLDDRFIFSTQEGYSQLHQLEIGWKNRFAFLPSIYYEWDIKSKYFFDPKDRKANPFRIYAEMALEKEQFLWSLSSSICSENLRLNHLNSSLQWTFSRNGAWSLDFLYRSPRFFRKARRDLYFLENTRSLENLLLSPLSDERATILSQAFYRFTPYSTVEAAIRYGFLRKNEPAYVEYRIETKTLMMSGCEIRMTFEHTENDDRFTFGLELLKR